MSNTAALMALVPSPYVHYGADTFVVRDQEVLPVFQADHGRVVLLPVAVAQELASGSVAPGMPGHAQVVEMGLAGTDIAQFRRAYLERLGEDEPAGQRHFVLLPTSYCNMGCEYCGQTHVKQSLAPDHRDAVSARVLAAASDDAVTEVHVAWFGGEPLMAYAVLRQMARGFVEAFDQVGKAYTSKITTNGALLDERKLPVLITELRIHRLDITIDGRLASTMSIDRSRTAVRRSIGSHASSPARCTKSSPRPLLSCCGRTLTARTPRTCRNTCALWLTSDSVQRPTWCSKSRRSTPGATT
jgi:hypothetical protein